MDKIAYNLGFMSEIKKIANINLGKDQSLNTGALGGLVGSGLVSSNMIKSQYSNHKNEIKDILKSTMGKAEKVKKLAPYLTAIGVAGAIGTGIGAVTGKFMAKGMEKMLIHEKTASENIEHPKGFGQTASAVMKHPVRFAGNVLGGTGIGMVGGSIAGSAITAPTFALASGLMSARKHPGTFASAFKDRLMHGMVSESVGGGIAGGLMGANRYFKNQKAGTYNQVKQAAFISEFKKIAGVGGMVAGGMKSVGAMANKTAPSIANKMGAVGRIGKGIPKLASQNKMEDNMNVKQIKDNAIVSEFKKIAKSIKTLEDLKKYKNEQEHEAKANIAYAEDKLEWNKFKQNFPTTRKLHSAAILGGGVLGGAGGLALTSKIRSPLAKGAAGLIGSLLGSGAGAATVHQTAMNDNPAYKKAFNDVMTNSEKRLKGFES